MTSEDKHKKKKAKKRELPEHLEVQRQNVICGAEMNFHPSTSISANMYAPMGVDNSWSFREFVDNMEIKVNRLTKESMEFELIGVDPAIANALRRILIAEVPTIAIEHVFIINNTSVIQDEVLSHRLGLVPLNVHPDALQWRGPEDAINQENTLVLRLALACSRKPGVGLGAAGGLGIKDEDTINGRVYSSALQWLPQGSEMPDETGCRFTASQAGAFPADALPAPVHADILLARLRPGQVIELEAHAIKGVGREHAKWSPVATAWYRLRPEVVLLQRVAGADAQQLVEAFRNKDGTPGLFVLEGAELRVRDALDYENRLEEVRRLLEQDKWRDVIQLRKHKTHFIFTVESTGAMTPDELVVRALDILREKAAKLGGRL